MKLYRITNKHLGESRSLTATQDGPQMQPTANNLTQYWELITQSDGSKKIFCFWGGEPKFVGLQEYDINIYTLQWAENKDPRDQLWTIIKTLPDYSRFINHSQSHKSMSTDEQTADLVEMEPSAAIDKQYWKLTELTSSVVFDETKYYRITNNRIGKAQSLEGGQDGVMMNVTENKDTQYWQFLKQANGLYKLQTTPFAEKKVMDVILPGEEYKPVMTDSTIAAGQFWYIIKNKDGSYSFMNRWQTELALSSDQASKPNNELVYLVGIDDLDAENWTITEVDLNKD